MTITLPDEVGQRVESLAKRRGYASATAYLVDLIAEAEATLDDEEAGPPDSELSFRTPEELHAKLLEGINSGPPIRVTPEFWEERRRKLAEKRAARGQAGGNP